MRLLPAVLTLFAFGPVVLAAGQSAPSTPAPKQSAPPPPAVKVGDTAPDFTLRYLAKTPDGKFEPKTLSLGEFKGKKSVILAFFPAAFSPG